MVIATIVSAILQRYEMKQLFPKALLVANSDRNHCTRGFTVLELIVIVAIVALLAVIAALNLSEWKDNVYLKTAAREVVSNFQFARVEAAKRSAPMLVQVTVGGVGAGGCIVFIDNGQGGGTDGDSIPNGGETLRNLALPPRVTISSTTTSPYVFNNRGFPIAGGGTVVLTNGNRTYNVVLSPAGSISLNGPM
jgi:Tfp pilus assembly protein FimT